MRSEFCTQCAAPCGLEYVFCFVFCDENYHSALLYSYCMCYDVYELCTCIRMIRTIRKSHTPKSVFLRPLSPVLQSAVLRILSKSVNICSPPHFIFARESCKHRREDICRPLRMVVAASKQRRKHTFSVDFPACVLRPQLLSSLPYPPFPLLPNLQHKV